MGKMFDQRGETGAPNDGLEGDRDRDGRADPASGRVDDPPIASPVETGAPPSTSQASTGRARRGSLPPVLYPNEYVWFVFFSSLDVMLTWAILKREGAEVNPFAKYVIDLWGLNGAIAFKFSLMIFVIIVCEWVGHTRHRAGQRLIRLCVLVSALPVVWSLFLLLMHTYGQWSEC
ncbi:MAG: DUF5658 family protein [Phycisphaerales bacterium]